MLRLILSVIYNVYTDNGMSLHLRLKLKFGLLAIMRSEVRSVKPIALFIDRAVQKSQNIYICVYVHNIL